MYECYSNQLYHTRLYPSCEWEPKQIRRLISNGHLAARLKGSDSRLTKTDRECPICFMYYSETNISKCCNATLCTECYLQIKPQKDKHTSCPFCNNPKMCVNVQGGMDEGDVAKREEEEQRVIEATIKSRLSNLNGEHPGPRTPGADGGDGDESDNTEASFGSSLENYNRSRTFSNASSSGFSAGSGGDVAPSTPNRLRTDSSDAEILQSLAMSPDDRRALESEMRAQLSHETHRRMESEAEEARMRHTQEWYGSGAGMRARIREARLAELTGLLERMSARGGGLGGGGSDNDENEGSLMAGEGEGGMGRGGRGGGASLSRLLRAMEASNPGVGSRGGTLEDLMRLEAAFIVGMGTDNNARRSQRNATGRRSSGRSSRSSGEEDNDSSAGDTGLTGGGRHTIGGSSSRRAPRRLLASNRGGMSSTHLDTAELLMRGVSEEEQLAMAIAMSMQDAQESTQQQAQSTQEGDGGGGNQQEVAAGDEQSNNRQGGAEEDSLSSESSASDSSNSSGEGAENETNTDSNNQVANNGRNEIDANVDAVSLDEDEEEVVFSDSAEV